MNNCICQLFDNHWVWLIVIAILLFCCGGCGNGCGNGYGCN